VLSPTAPSRAATVGEVVAGRYRVERVLGRGGMAYVVAATELEHGTTVALKFLHPEILRDDEAVVRFEREGRTAAMIDSPYACRVLDVGVSPDHGPYLVMEYLEGDDLGAHVGRARLAVADAAAFVIQACDALGCAHALGIVHRDLKPANLFLAHQPDGSALVKLLDFGISKIAAQSAERGEPTLTPTMRLMGSIEYMSPEQMRSAKHVDHRTDVWALGAILFELLTGQTPFAGPGVNAVVINIARAEPASLCGLRPDVPAALERVVVRCLQKELTERTSSVGRLALELRPFAPGFEPLVAAVVARCLPFDSTLRAAPETPAAGPSTPLAPQPSEPNDDADATLRRDLVLPWIVPSPQAPAPREVPPWATEAAKRGGAARDGAWVWIALSVLAVLGLAAALGWSAWTELRPR
jgi:serine/threonine-protein kinase